MLFILPIILVDYSQEVSLLFQFGVPIVPDVTFILEKTINFVCGCYYSITESEIYIPLYSAEFCLREKAFSKRENTLDLSIIIVTRLREMSIATL